MYPSQELYLQEIRETCAGFSTGWLRIQDIFVDTQGCWLLNQKSIKIKFSFKSYCYFSQLEHQFNILGGTAFFLKWCCEEKFPPVGDWEQFIHSVMAMLSCSTDQELLDSRSRGHASWNGPAVSTGICLKCWTHIAYEGILETSYHIENLREIFETSCEEQAFLWKEL